MSEGNDTTLKQWLILFVGAGVLLSTAVGPTFAQSSPSGSITIEIQADGSAEWTVVTAVPLPLEADREAFDAVADNETRKVQILNDTVALYEALAEGASAELNREMTVNNGSIELRRDGSTGFIIVTFQWAAFAQVEDNTMTVGDVFTGGFPVRANETVSIHGPEEYQLTSHNVTSPNATVEEGTESEITWKGPDTIRSSIQLRYERPTPVPESTATESDTSPPDETATETASATGAGFGIVATLLAILVIVVGIRRD